jgi:hypothetical protein
MAAATSAAEGIGDGGVAAHTLGWLPATVPFYARRKNGKGNSEMQAFRAGTDPEGLQERQPGFR